MLKDSNVEQAESIYKLINVILKIQIYDFAVCSSFQSYFDYQDLLWGRFNEPTHWKPWSYV
jgi:hypothetical protein